MTQHPAAEIVETLFDDAEAEARWRARFTAPRVTAPKWARDADSRSLYLSNASGTWEVYAWDRDTDTHRKVTDRPNGTYHSALPPGGADVWWFADKDGDEFGRWVAEPFHADGRTAEPAVDGVPDGYQAGLAIGTGLVAVGTATDDGSTIWLAHNGKPARTIYSHKEDAWVGALSRDETLLALAHSEHGDSRHPAIRIIEPSGAPVADLWDGPAKGVYPLSFSPVAGDQRLLVSHERRGREELLIWDVMTGAESEVRLDLPGEVTADWYPDASALLVLHTHHARSTLHRYDIASGELSTLDSPKGTISAAGVRDDGTVEYGWSSAAQPSMVRSLRPDGTDVVLLTPRGDTAPPSVELADVWVDGPGGSVHAMYAKPSGAEGPLPTVFSIHGGPHAADEDRYSPARSLWIDEGYAVVHVNYRGSAGYGSAWRDAIEGRPGLTELQDIAAVHDWAVHSGLSDPERCVFHGYSWGGYLTLLALGTQPERWQVGVAGIPVADYLAAYEDEMEQMRAFDRALFGGSPEDVPELYRQASPITYVEQVRAPVLVVAGENDPRCPIRQIDNYLDALAANAKDYAVYRYDAGHGSLVVAETMRQCAAEVAFVRSRLGSG